MLYDAFKFLLGFFCGILLYFAVFDQLRKFGLRRLSANEILGSLSDMYGSNIIYRSETENDNRYQIMLNLDRDIHYRSDNATLANRLSEQVRILCAVLVDYRYASERVPAINATWGGRCSELILFTAIARSPITKFKHYVLSMQDAQYVYNYRQRVVEVLSTVYTHHYNESDWFILATDETYVIMENLRYFLYDQNASLPLFFGRINPFEYFVLRYFRTNQRFSFTIALSKTTLRIINLNLTSASRPDNAVTGDVYEDLYLDGMGIKSLNGKDKHGLDRFNIVIPDRWGSHISDRDIQLRDVKKISDFPVSFRCVTYAGMYGMELLTYHLRPFGILHPHEDVN